MQDENVAAPIEKWEPHARALIESLDRVLELVPLTGDDHIDSMNLTKASIQDTVNFQKKDDTNKSDIWKVFEQFVNSEEFTPEIAYHVIVQIANSTEGYNEAFEKKFADWYTQQYQFQQQSVRV